MVREFSQWFVGLRKGRRFFAKVLGLTYCNSPMKLQTDRVNVLNSVKYFHVSMRFLFLNFHYIFRRYLLHVLQKP